MNERDLDRLIAANTKLVDENKYLKIDKEVLQRGLKTLMNIISRNEILMTEEESEVFEKYYFMVRGYKDE